MILMIYLKIVGDKILYSCFCHHEEILSFIEKCTHFLSIILAFILAALLLMYLDDRQKKGVGMFHTIRRPKLYYLTFIHMIGQELRLQGKKDTEIQEELLKRYKDNALPFLWYKDAKRKDDIEFVGKILEDKDALFKYVVTPIFGLKSYQKLLTEFNEEKRIREAKRAIEAALIDNTPDKVEECFQWLPKLFYLPYIAQEDGDVKRQENTAAIYYYLNKPKDDKQEAGSMKDTEVQPYFKDLKIRGYLELLKKMKTVYLDMDFSESLSSFSGSKSTVERKIKRREKIYEFIAAEEQRIRGEKLTE